MHRALVVVVVVVVAAALSVTSATGLEKRTPHSAKHKHGAPHTRAHALQASSPRAATNTSRSRHAVSPARIAATQEEHDFLLLYDLEECSPPSEYINGVRHYVCDENFPLARKACQSANAALARQALRIRQANAEHAKPDIPDAQRVTAPPLQIVEDLPEEINVTLGESIRLELQVANADGKDDANPVTYLWTKDILHPATNEASGSTFFRESALLEDAGTYQCVASNVDHAVFSRATKVNVLPRQGDPGGDDAPKEERKSWDALEKQYSLDICHSEMFSAPDNELVVPPVCDYAVTLCHGVQRELCNPPPPLKDDKDGKDKGDNEGDEDEDKDKDKDKGDGDNEHECKANLHKCRFVVRDCFYRYNTNDDKYRFALCFFAAISKKIEVPKLPYARLQSINLQQDNGAMKCLENFDPARFHYQLQLPFSTKSIRLQLVPVGHGQLSQLSYHRDCADGRHNDHHLVSLPSSNSPHADGGQDEDADEDTHAVAKLDHNISPVIAVGDQCRVEFEIKVRGMDDGAEKEYSLVVTQEAPKDTCEVEGFWIDDVPFEFDPSKEYYAPLYTAWNVSVARIHVNTEEHGQKLKVRQACGRGWYVGKEVELRHGMNRVEMQLKTQANRDCPVYTFMIQRLLAPVPVLASSDTQLSILRPLFTTRKPINMDPPFDPEWPLYRAFVSVDTDAVLIRTQTSSEGSHVSIGECGWYGIGSDSPPFYLLPGPNVIPVVVTAQNQHTLRTYTVTVIKRDQVNALAGKVATASATMLQSLELHLPGQHVEHLPLVGALTAFSYSVPHDVDMLFLLPVTELPNARVTINGDATYNGHESKTTERKKPIAPVRLLPGPNKVIVGVTDGVSSREYQLTVMRALPAAPNNPSHEAFLSALEVAPYSAGEHRWNRYLPPELKKPQPELMDGGSYEMRVWVDESSDFFLVRPFAALPDMTIVVDGSAVESGQVSARIPTPWSSSEFGRQDENSYWVTVTAQDTTTVASYELRVQRSCPLDKFFDHVSDKCSSCVEAVQHYFPQHKEAVFKNCKVVTCTSPCNPVCVSCPTSHPLMCSNKLDCVAALGVNEDRCPRNLDADRRVCEKHIADLAR